jgi:hypothetical protein
MGERAAPAALAYRANVPGGPRSPSAGIKTGCLQWLHGGPANGGDPRDKRPLRGLRRSTEVRTRRDEKNAARGSPEGVLARPTWSPVKLRGPRRPAPAPLALSRERKARKHSPASVPSRGNENGCLKSEPMPAIRSPDGRRSRLSRGPGGSSTRHRGSWTPGFRREARLARGTERTPCPMNRDGRDKPGHDGKEAEVS